MNPLEKLPELVAGARKSAEGLQYLNATLCALIPFNGPHGFQIAELREDSVKTRAPYTRENFNHIQGIHACGIATIAELSAGLLLLSRLDPRQYRLIMARMEVEYHYQARQDVIAETIMSPEEIEREVISPLQEVDTLTRTMKTEVRDLDDHLVATVLTTWQIKPWNKVRTAAAG